MTDASETIPRPGDEGFSIRPNRETRCRILAMLQADPEPVLLVEAGWFEKTREWLLLSEWAPLEHEKASRG